MEKDTDVENRIKDAEMFQEKYKDILYNDSEWNNLSPKEFAELEEALHLETMKAHEDAKRLYLGYPQKYNSFEPSSYKPTIGNSDNPYQLNNLLTDGEFENLILPAWID